MGTTPALTWDRVLAWRLRRHHLVERDGDDAVAVVDRLSGVQAQVTSAAEQVVARRTRDGSGAGAALATNALVRTWAMRGTLHLLSPDRAPDVLAVIAAARTWEKGAWQRGFATAEQVAALTAAATDVLDGAVLTREELVADLADRIGDPGLVAALGSGWGTLLKPLAWQGVLVNGPVRDARPTFTAPRTLVPGWPDPPDPDDAARRVVPAYLAAHGPATPATFDAWLLRGATPRARLRRWFADLVADGTLTVVHVGGEPRHARTADVDDLLAAEPVPGVQMLPGFDPWVLGPGTDHAPVVPPAHRARVSRTAGWIAPVVLVDGRVVATWSLDGDVVTVEPLPDAAVPDRRDLDAEVDTWSALLGRPLALRA